MGERKKILIVEAGSKDRDKTQRLLEEENYLVAAKADTGEEAIRLTAELNPDLVLMDIKLEGEMDGINTGIILKNNFEVPIVFVTALSDQNSLERAKLSEPFGYIIKPFEKEQLFCTIKIALYKGRMDQIYKDKQRWFITTLKSIGDAVIATDCFGQIKFMNPVAEELTGWKQEEVKERKLEEIFNIFSELDGKRVENPVSKVLEKGMIIGLANHTVLKRKDGMVIPIDDSAAPIWDEHGLIEGVVLVFRDVTERKKMEEHQKRLERSLVASRKKIKQLHHVASKINLCSAKEDVYQLTVDAAEKILKFYLCTLDIVENDLLVVKAYSTEADSHISVSMPITDGIAGKTYRNQRTYLVQDVRDDHDAKPTKSYFRSLISIPIDEFGIFQVISKEINAFSEEDLELAELLISHTITALKRIKSEEKIWYFGFHDPLTDLYNRNYFDEELVRLDTERQLPLSIIMGDVNGLKLVNDAFGHKEGDRFLQKMAQIIKESCRQEDIIARWGGDEFMILLQKTGAEAANEVVKRIKTGCEEAENEPIKPSIALGVATKNIPDEKIEDVLKLAEDRMYRNKLKESKNPANSIISILESCLRNKKFETEGHRKRIGQLVLKIGQELRLSKSKMEELSLLALLHDIGLLAISDDILYKPGPLSIEQWAMIKKHPEIGYRIAKTSPETAPIAEDILSHHECWDGSGYPQGLIGESIPLLARILAIADAYDVMTHNRPYKKAISSEEAIKEILNYSGSQFDEELVKIFIKVIEDNPS